MAHTALGVPGQSLFRLLNGRGISLSAALHTVAAGSRPLGAQSAITQIDESALGGNRPFYRAMLVDAAGTFLIPTEQVADVYLRYARPHGCMLEEGEVLSRFRRCGWT